MSLDALLLLYCAETRKVPQDAPGFSLANTRELAEALVEQEAVPRDRQCHIAGCDCSASVLCYGCRPGGMQLCEAHDIQQHQWAHTHQRVGLLNGFKQPLRPTQLQYDNTTGSWSDLPLVFDQPPCAPCSCGGCSWDLVPPDSDSGKLIIVTGYGKSVRSVILRMAARHAVLDCHWSVPRMCDCLLDACMASTAGHPILQRAFQWCTAVSCCACRPARLCQGWLQVQQLFQSAVSNLA
jgi:hypothetical protein